MRRSLLSIKEHKDDNRPNLHWRIEGYYENGKRKRVFFKTKQEADTISQ